MPQRSKLCQEAHSKKARLIRKQRVAFVQNKLAQEAEKSTVSKEKLEEYARKLQGMVEELERKNYYLERKGRVLRGLVGDYQGRNRFLEDFALMVFILGQLVVGLYLLGLFDGNNACVTIF